MTSINSAHRDVRALPIGYVLSDYTFEKVLGSGSFGITYLALDSMLNRRVAIKEYFPREFAAREGTLMVHAVGDGGDLDNYTWGLKRFLEEARILAMFDHPNIIPVRRFFEANGTAYLVMDYCDGIPLDKLIEENGPLDNESLKQIIYPILDALEQVHRAHLLHRDIKPANIFIKTNGSPVLLDFGAARQEVVSHSKSVTSIVTPGYGALEQYSTHGEQGPSTDIYGFAATLYKVITGLKPQDAASRMLDDKVVPAKLFVADKYDSGILSAIDKAMSIKPQDRPQSIQEWKNIFLSNAHFRSDASLKESDESATILIKSNKPAEKNYLPRALIFGGLFFTVLFAIWYVVGFSDKSDSPSSHVSQPQMPKKVDVVEASAPIKEVPEKKISEKTPPQKSAPSQNEKKITSNKKICPKGASPTSWSDCYGETKFKKENVRRWSYYEGFFKDGLMDGQGTLLYQDDRKYVGEMKASDKHGRGTLTYRDGTVYVGEFERDFMSGQGVKTLPNGDKYIGEFKSDKFNGQGTYTEANGAKYIGRFLNDKRHGVGTSYDSNGVIIFQGQWINGSAVVTAAQSNSSGQRGSEVFKQCKQYADKAKANLNPPKKLENNVTVTDISCEPGSPKPKFTYRYKWDTLLDINQSWMNSNMYERTKKVACGDGLKPYIGMVDIEFHWAYGDSSEASKYPGKFMGILRYTENDCR